jgi:hypothetical protein
MAADTVCKFAPFRGQRDDKRAPIRFSDLTRNQVPFRQPIQNADQCRSLISASIAKMWTSPCVKAGSSNLSR